MVVVIIPHPLQPVGMHWYPNYRKLLKNKETKLWSM
jgi:hypothetical protein